MHISWTYLDTKKATAAALKVYSEMEFNIKNHENMKEILQEDLVYLPSSAPTGMVTSSLLRTFS